MINFSQKDTVLSPKAYYTNGKEAPETDTCLKIQAARYSLPYTRAKVLKAETFAVLANRRTFSHHKGLAGAGLLSFASTPWSIPSPCFSLRAFPSTSREEQLPCLEPDLLGKELTLYFFLQDFVCPVLTILHG